MVEPFSSGPKSKKELFAELSKKRKEMIDAEKERARLREEAGETQKKTQEETFLKDVSDARKRSEKREEWRQDMHEKKREERIEAEKRKLEQDRQAKLKAQKDEQKERDRKEMENLHKHAIEKRVTTSIEGAKVQEERQKKDVTKTEEKRVEDLDLKERNAVASLDREITLKKSRIEADAQRRRNVADEKLKHAKEEVRREAQAMEDKARRGGDTQKLLRDAQIYESQHLMRAQAEHTRETMAIDEGLQKELFDLGTEAKSLKGEIKHDIDTRRQRASAEGDRKRGEAQKRREGVEKWFNRGFLPEKKDDLL